MHDRLSRSLSLLAVALTCAAGCTADPAPPPPTGDTGTLVLPLIQAGPDGEIFHLAHATFDIAGLVNGFTGTVDGSGFVPQVSISVPPGLVGVTLRDGWTLERSTDNGATFQPVSALLASPNPSNMRVLVNVPASIIFEFIVRNPNGTLQIKLAVEDAPRELAGGVLIETATGKLAGYNSPARTLDFGVFYDLFSLSSEILPDGTRQHVYVANHVAVEFYNDRIGTFSGSIAHQLTGAFLNYTVAARPDGTVELSGELAGNDATGTTDITFGPNVIDDEIGIGADGFPEDQFFYDPTLPFSLFTITGDDDGTADGQLRLRHLIPGQPGADQ